MSHFDTIINSKKERVPTKPNIFSFIGYDKFRYPFVQNYFVLAGYSCFVKKSRKCYQIFTVGWTCAQEFTPNSCTFELFGEYCFNEYYSHSEVLDAFSEVCSCLCSCFLFDYIKDDYIEFLQDYSERIAYENHSADDAEHILTDLYGGKELFNELS
ncbi:hypothetical protein [Peromfec virus RodF5_3]|uniref:Uncharacterized protein n=1 Tax=Peromfec virus RodF5_3 TaxID=2929339 RepID=A0A976N302_9VIRU|nr:hypothetical protein [Peromfec virus RodF5_3]